MPTLHLNQPFKNLNCTWKRIIQEALTLKPFLYLTVLINEIYQISQLEIRSIVLEDNDDLLFSLFVYGNKENCFRIIIKCLFKKTVYKPTEIFIFASCCLSHVFLLCLISVTCSFQYSKQHFQQLPSTRTEIIPLTRRLNLFSKLFPALFTTKSASALSFFVWLAQLMQFQKIGNFRSLRYSWFKYSGEIRALAC